MNRFPNRFETFALDGLALALRPYGAAQLDFLCDFEWNEHFAADPSLRRLGRLRAFLDRVKTARAAIERQRQSEEARDIPVRTGGPAGRGGPHPHRCHFHLVCHLSTAMFAVSLSDCQTV